MQREAAAVRRIAVVALAVAAGGVVARPAAANTLSYSGTITARDRSYGPVAGDDNSPSVCGVAPSLTTAPGTANYQAYAFRNTAGGGLCVNVTYSFSCSATSGVLGASYNGWFDPTSSATNFAGGENHCALGPAQSTYSFLQPFTDPTFIVLVTGLIAQANPLAPYNLSVSGASIAPAQAVQASGFIQSNTLALHASSLPDGTAVEGTVAVHDASGHAYSGPVRCLRISGESASLVMTFDGTQTGVPAADQGAVFWLHEGTVNVDSDGQRNVLLTAGQLAHTYASCPDPTAPPHGSFATVLGGDVSVITDPPTP